MGAPQIFLTLLFYAEKMGKVKRSILTDEKFFDVLVVGGGGTTCRAAVAAAEKGAKTAMVVKGSFGKCGSTAVAMAEIIQYAAAVGSEDLIEKAKWARQEVGGAMRQAGIIAASGIIAIEKMIDRLKDDHRNARILAEGLAEMDGISLDLETVQTNIVMFDVSGLGVDSNQFVSALNERGIKSKTRGRTAVRMLTLRGVEEEDVHYALNVIEDVVKELHKHPPI